MPKNMRFLLILSFLSFAYALQAQEVISGKILDGDTDEPLLGASISTTLSTGQILGTTSDLDGYFSLTLPEAQSGGMLSVEYLGYDDHLVILSNQTRDLTISMRESSTLLETTTITGSRYEKSLAESPVSISVIKPDLIERSNTTIASDLLDKVPGVQVIDGQANIRGGSGYSYGAGSRVLLLIDDIPALQADAGRPLWDDIPVENISQVEVLKGASSALYGSAALNGIINIRTGYATSEPETKGFFSYRGYFTPADPDKAWWKGTDTTPKTLTAGLTHKQKFGKLDVVAAAGVELDHQVNIDSFKDRYRLSTNLKYRLSDRITFGLNAMYNYKNSANYILWENARDGAYRGWEGTLTAGETERFYIDPQLTIYDKKKNKHKVLGRYYKLNNGSTTAQATTSSNAYLEYQYTGSMEAWGLEYTGGASSYIVRTNSELYGNVDLSNNNYALFAQVDKRFGNLILTAGTRYENNQQSNVLATGNAEGTLKEGRIVSRFGANYSINDKWFLRSSWGQGYRFPTIAERFIFTDLGGFFILPNPTLESETGWTAEVGIKRNIDIGHGSAYIDVAFFRSEYSNMLEFTFDQIDGQVGFQSRNVGNTLINGLEIDFVGAFPLSKKLGVKYLMGYTYLDPKYQDFDTNEEIRRSVSAPVNAGDDPNFLKYRSKHNFKIDAEMSLGNIGAGFSYNYSTQIVTIDQFLSTLNEIGQFRDLKSGGFGRLDGRISYNFGTVKLSLQGKNLTNNEYSLRPGILEPPRNLAVRADFKF